MEAPIDLLLGSKRPPEATAGPALERCLPVTQPRTTQVSPARGLVADGSVCVCSCVCPCEHTSTCTTWTIYSPPSSPGFLKALWWVGPTDLSSPVTVPV